MVRSWLGKCAANGFFSEFDGRSKLTASLRLVAGSILVHYGEELLQETVDLIWLGSIVDRAELSFFR